jgi:SAM-dependent methyltransferase
MSKDYKYLLGDAAREASRLRAQARLWDPVSRRLFDRVGVGPGWKVLEIGPGQGSLHLELRRRVRGPVDAVERSTAFAARLQRLAARDGYGDGRFWTTNLQDADLPANHYDLIFARWVFLFLPEPLAHLKQLARALTPGGRIAIQDYHRNTFTLIPQPPEWGDFLEADRRFFASQGGNASIGCLLPALLESARLQLEGIEATVLSGHPRSAVWNWLTTYFMGVMDRYAEHAPFSPGAAARLRSAWTRAGRSSAALLVAPAVLDLIARKPPRRV